MSETTQQLPSTLDAPRNPTLVKVGWFCLGLFSLLFFTILKIPEQKIKIYVENTLINTLAQYGYTLSTIESQFSLLFLTYSLKGVTLQGPPPAPLARADRIDVSPSLFSLLTGKSGGNFTIYQESGILKGSVAVSHSRFSLSYQAKKFDIGKVKLLPMTAGILGGGILNGNGSIQGEFNSPSSWEGDLLIDLEKIQIEPQSIVGFSVPRISISEGTTQIVFEKGKANVKVLRMGKLDNLADDLRGSLAGDLVLGKTWDLSTLNLKTDFTFSDNILKAFVLLESLLGPGKHPDGKYHFAITGSVQGPIYTPVALTK